MDDKTNEQLSLHYPNEPKTFSANDISAFIVWSTEQGTSDVTIQNEEKIICDIHGKKVRVTNRKMTRTELISIISEIYTSDGALSKLNGGEAVDIPWSVRIDRNKILRFRVNMTAIFADGHKGYSITIRTINNRAPLLEDLNLQQDIIDNLTHKEGLIIVVGATGSGKSTLLASVLDWRMRQPLANLKILTYESPIEYVYDDVPKPTSIISQSEIGSHLPTFAEGIRNALRRKPDIILIGELRDRETIGEAIVASQTGHLVYGTLHSTGVAAAIRRMVNAFETEEKLSRTYEIISSIKLIVAQKLVGSTDGKRVALREYLAFTDEIRETILDGNMDNLIQEVAKQLSLYGRTFLQDAKEKLDNEIISFETYEGIRKSIQGSKKPKEELLTINPRIETVIENKEMINDIENNIDFAIKEKIVEKFYPKVEEKKGIGKNVNNKIKNTEWDDL